jgi:hypothetical protein
MQGYFENFIIFFFKKKCLSIFKIKSELNKKIITEG